MSTKPETKSEPKDKKAPKAPKAPKAKCSIGAFSFKGMGDSKKPIPSYTIPTIAEVVQTAKAGKNVKCATFTVKKEDYPATTAGFVALCKARSSFYSMLAVYAENGVSPEKRKELKIAAKAKKLEERKTALEKKIEDQQKKLADMLAKLKAKK